MQFQTKKLDFKSDILSEDMNLKLKTIYDELKNKPEEAHNLLKYIIYLQSEDQLIQYHGLIGLRLCMHGHHFDVIDEVIEHGAIPILVRIIKAQLTPYHVYEACDSIQSLLSGSLDDVEKFIEEGGIGIIVKLVESNIMEIAEQAIWILGQIAGDYSEFRDMVLEAQGHKAIITFADKYKHVNRSFDECVQTLSKMIKLSPTPEFDQVKVVIPFLCRIIQSTPRTYLLKHALESLDLLTTDYDGYRQIYELKTLERFNELLDRPTEILFPALRILGNIVKGDVDMIQCVMDTGILLKSPQLLQHNDSDIREETCLLLSNIAAAGKYQSYLLLRSEETMKILYKIARHDLDNIRVEAIYTFACLASQVAAHDFAFFIKYKFFKICKMNLLERKVKLTYIIYEALAEIIQIVLIQQTQVPIKQLEIYQFELLYLWDLCKQSSTPQLKEHLPRIARIKVDFIDRLKQHRQKK